MSPTSKKGSSRSDSESRRRQRVSFAYGNANLSNENVTKEMVADLADGDVVIDAYQYPSQVRRRCPECGIRCLHLIRDGGLVRGVRTIPCDVITCTSCWGQHLGFRGPALQEEVLIEVDRLKRAYRDTDPRDTESLLAVLRECFEYCWECGEPLALRVIPHVEFGSLPILLCECGESIP